MKKILIYTGILIAGLVLGYLFFANSSEEKNTEHEHEQGETETMWTCSMHPQIMQNEPGDCPICGMDLIPADVSADGLSADQFSMTENAMKLANIQTTVVGQLKGTDGEVTLSGKIEVNDDQNAAMPAHFDGRVEKLYVNTVGDKVGMGQTIASIYSPELVAAQQELITAVKLKNSQPQLYKAVRNKFKNWKISESMLDEIESSGEVRTSWPIHSHVTGTVTEIMVEEGAHVIDGMPIFKVSNLNSVWAVFDAYESQISNLKEGQNLDISVNAIPNENFSGKISFIDPILNNDSRTVEIRVVLNNRNNQLKPGMFVQAETEAAASSKGKSLEVPKSSVMWTGERSLVYVKTSATEPVFEMREVKLGNSSGETYQVLEGLSEGEEIVTNGTFTVDAAAQLQGKSSMMNQKVALKSEKGMEMKLSEEFQAEFNEILNAYFELKDALVASKADKTSEKASELLQKVSKIKIEGSSQMLAGHWGKVTEMLEAISQNDDLENQRAHFRILSQQMIMIAQNLQNLDKTIYVQHCPMANSNKGADWLSQSSEVRNPYYGEAMLSCGEVTLEIK
ncbi:efflux RND transporter periplasmic adaptor subunit [Gramella sp. MAR_2010_147]|uniref:efflux RND transporter periplasmic adaptor subunit n=1 Tax=Gramella sp. MAR_2010_147 TaxID=1250205 RepID=UPI00087BCDD7|nr:efflux RND transporter periplasmic adaptor subunit [Gramella sp. MAR_2010_147]SDS51898.1 membrane fusion protein, Cu(I)/Ag(I) efflux system [Gramella sp. MAR_2010_147]